MHPKLRAVADEAIKHYDFKVLEGYRSPERGEYLASKHLSDTGAASWHCRQPARAFDLAPWPIDWKDERRFAYMAGIVMACASALGVKLRWGGDWDSDGNQKEHKLWDGGHFELVEDET